MRGMTWQGYGFVRQPFMQREIELEIGERSVGVQRAQQAITLGEQTAAVLAGMDQRGTVRQHRERARLRPGQLLGGTTEVAPCRGIEADYIAAERRVRCVQRQDLTLAVRQLESRGHCHLEYLFWVGSWWVLARHADHLHAERASAAHDLLARGVRIQRARHRDRVHSRV